MEGKDLSIALREMARVQPNKLCDKWYESWKDDTDIDTLLNKFIRGFDFCQDNDYPPLEFIRNHFNKSDLHRHNIYVDEEVRIEEATSGHYVFLGKCRAYISFSGFTAATIYCRHESEVDVHSSGSPVVFVTYYDHSKGECVSDGMRKIRRYDRTLAI